MEGAEIWNEYTKITTTTKCLSRQNRQNRQKRQKHHILVLCFPWARFKPRDARG